MTKKRELARAKVAMAQKALDRLIKQEQAICTHRFSLPRDTETQEHMPACWVQECLDCGFTKALKC